MSIRFSQTPGKLLLADGTRFDGYLETAAPEPVWGEVVFNTSMTGYQEVITDPSYAGQLIVMTYPQIGNYGVSGDDCESGAIAARALVVRELAPFYSPGPGRSGIRGFIERHGLACLSGVDTRALTLRVRTGGAVTGIVAPASVPDTRLHEMLGGHEYSRNESLVGSVTGAAGRLAQRIHPGGTAITRRAALMDLGAKKSIIAELRALGVDVAVFDMHVPAAAILAGGFDFLVLSNGPGDPADVPGVIRTMETLAGRIPILGICLGHQVMALALGGTTYKMKFGHRGANQPVVCRRSGSVLITTQNHGYAVSDAIAGTAGIEITWVNGNDGTVEGFCDPGRSIECVQFHPEAGPGPRDTTDLFADFIKDMQRSSHATVG